MLCSFLCPFAYPQSQIVQQPLSDHIAWVMFTSSPPPMWLCKFDDRFTGGNRIFCEHEDEIKTYLIETVAQAMLGKTMETE